MTFMTTSVLPDFHASGGNTSAAAMLQDASRGLRQLGMRFLRAAVVDARSMAVQASWALNSGIEATDEPAERAQDSVFPGAAAVVARLEGATPEQTVTHKLSPRRWAFVWRFDERMAVIAEVHFTDRRDEVGAADVEFVRLLCSAHIRANQAPANSTAAAGSAGPVWPQVDRRARGRPSAGSWIGFGLACLATLACVWLAAVSLPRLGQLSAQQEGRVQQLRKTADNTLLQGLANALATGDYGEVQNELSQFAALGYFDLAVVTNARGRVVAVSGAPEGVRVGDPVPADFAARVPPRPLAIGAERYGELLVSADAQASAASLGDARWLALLACASSAGLATLLALRLARRLR